MGRFVLVVMVVIGIGYGGWSLLHGPDGKAALSGTEEVGAGETERSDAPAEGDAERTARKAVPAEEIERVVRQAEEALAESSSAPSRVESLKAKDRARRLYSAAYFATRDEELARDLKARVDELNDDVLFSEVALPGKAFVHTFRATDRLYNLCKKTWPRERDVTIEPGFVLWLNGISDARFIREGQTLKVPTEELSLLVSKSRYRLWVLLGGTAVREYVVGVGVDDKTPEGEFEIDTRLENPAWYSEGKKIPYGHPDNPLGTRWLGFKRTPRAAGYGIHGTSEPGSVGRAVSQGCIRMENADVEELFEWVARGTRVKIVR